jgi:phage shock protein C
MAKQLRLSKTNKLFLGVIGGFADYFNVDATLLRVIFVLASILSAAFPGIVFYFIAWLIMSAADDSVVDTTAKKK